ncbi:MAG: hypothetical protein AAF357_08445, partial [Verrucomicrobiota bacterium]
MVSNPSDDHESFSSAELEALIQEYLDQEIGPEEFARLQAILKESPSARSRYLDATESVSLLQEIAVEEEREANVVTLDSSRRPASGKWLPLASAAAILLLGFFFYPLLSKPAVGARLQTSYNASWLSRELNPGDTLPIGTQIQLASGSVEIGFESGASSRIHGPALFEIESKNQGFLHYGKAYSIADDESSKGFTIRTGSITYVDQGTEFITQANADGFSQMMVLEGAVDAS